MRGSALLFLLVSSLGLLAPLAAQDGITKISVMQNGDFESGLSGWQKVDSGVGQSSVSKLVTRSGSFSLLLDLRPTSAVFDTEVQGAFQSTTVENLRNLELVAWALTAVCSFPEGVVGRLRVQVGELTLRYEVHGTCGTWRAINANVREDFQSAFGSQGSQLFEQNAEVPIIIALELVRAGANAMALAEYVALYWDDVEMIASIPVQSTTIATAVANTSTSAEETSTQTTQTVGQQTTTFTHVLTETQYLLGSPEQFYGALALIFAVAFGFSMALYVKSKLKRRTPPSSGERMGSLTKIFCRECGAKIPRYRDTKFCQECGAELV